jgi:hypothetical protein
VSTILPFTRNAVARWISVRCFLIVIFEGRQLRQLPQDDGCISGGNGGTVSVALAAFRHYAEQLGGAARLCARFHEKVPVVWDETRFVDGYPGKFCVIARRAGDKWYVAATHADHRPKELTLSLPWLAGRQVKLLYDRTTERLV